MFIDKDKILYDQFLKGDNDALEKLIEIHKEGLTLFIFGFLNNMADAQDMMIDVFAQLVISAGKFKGKSTLKTYLFTIARNEALKYIRKNKRNYNFDDISENLYYENDSLDINLLKKEENAQLYLAMSKLPIDYRNVLFLLYFEEMTYKEAAFVMKKTEKQITNLAYRSKKALKEKLEKGGFVYDEN